MRNKLELVIYGYDKQAFMPIYRDGALDNKREFVLYKLERVVDKLQSLYDRICK